MLTYSQVDFQDLRELFSVEVRSASFLPQPITPLPLPGWLREYLGISPLTPAISKSKKAVSEAVIYPLLSAVKAHHAGRIGLFSGEPLSSADLTGICGFILTTDPDSYEARPPIMVLVEAKRQDLLRAIPQCVAEMLVAQQLNQQAGIHFPAVYGCVTTGNQWQFLRLADNQAITDPRILYYSELEAVLGVLDWVVSQFDV